MKRSPLIVALALAVAMTGAHAELVYKWTGKDGKPVFGKQPPPGVRAEQVDIMPTKPGVFAKPERNSVDLSKLPRRSGADGQEEHYCPPQVSSCNKQKLGKGDKPMSPPLDPEPVERDKNGNILK